VYYQDHMGAGGWVLMVLIAVVLFGLLAVFVVWLLGDQRRRPPVEHFAGGVRPAGVTGSASEILDRRLATGDISIEEYQRVKASLAAPAAPEPVAPAT